MICKQCGKYFDEDVAECDECGYKNEIPTGKIPVLYHNNQTIYVEPPVITDVIQISNQKGKKKKRNILFPTFLVATICLVLYFVIYPNIKVNDNDTQYREEVTFNSSVWSSGEFMIDGNYHKIDEAYSKFVLSGWKYNSNDYIFLEDFTLDKDEKYPSYINLNNKDYSSSNIKVGFINYSNSPKEINKCNIWSIVIDNINTNDQVLFSLPGGIKNGSSIEDITNVYGKDSSNISRDETNKYTLLEYNDNSMHLELFVVDDEGLQKIELYKE